MSRQQCFLNVYVILLCLALAFPIQAQDKDCLPPVTLPATGQANIFSDEQEVYLGDAVAEQIQKDYRIFEDVELTGYLMRIGERLAKNLPFTKLRFQFFIVDLPEVNAFVLPGGRIYVSRKLVAHAHTEDELAGVISHEMGHLVTHESAIEATRQLKEVLRVTQVTDRRDVFEKYNQLMENAARKPGAFRSRDREKGQLNADQAGFYALVRAGYDPMAQARFWDRMTESKGKTGSWFSDLFGSTKPEELRLREMLKAVGSLPAQCIDKSVAIRTEEFVRWQALVISYSGFGRPESLRGVISKKQLSPPLRSEIGHIRFSPDGKFVLAQDDSGINVLTRQPFAPLFRIEAHDANPANFTPDAKGIVFYTSNLRVEYWDVSTEKMTDVKEVVVRKGCLQTALSPDGKILACLNPNNDLTLLSVATGSVVFTKKGFYIPSFFQLIMLIIAIANGVDEDTDFGFEMVNMGFSPDGHYFVSGYNGTVGFDAFGARAEAVDLNKFAKVPLSDKLKMLIAGNFTFFGNDRLIGVNERSDKASAMVTFPEGKVIKEYSLSGEVDAPTRGNYLLIRPIKDFPLGIMDLTTKTIVKANKQSALDIYDDVFVAERRNGEIALYRFEKSEVLATALLSNPSLGTLHVAELSRNMNWLALSGRTRGSVWNLGEGKSVLTLRAFRGGFLSDDGLFFGDFPEYDKVERNIPKFNLVTGDVIQGPTVDFKHALQYGQYLLVTKSADPKVKDNEYQAYDKNVRIDLLDARSMKVLWSKTFPKEAPRVWVTPNQETIVLRWGVKDEAAKAEIKADPRMSQQLAAMKEKEGDYFLQVLDAQTGNQLGKLLIETGKGSFRLSKVFAAGDWVVVTDTLNRVLVYSLKTGELKGRVFGGYATVSLANNLLCIENESGKLAIYDLSTMEKRQEFTFSSPVSFIRFSVDGRRLFVLTSLQNVYLFDVSSLANASSIGKHN